MVVHSGDTNTCRRVVSFYFPGFLPPPGFPVAQSHITDSGNSSVNVNKNNSAPSGHTEASVVVT